ncbi:MAG: SlyX family protein [Spirochaetota bacterium]
METNGLESRLEALEAKLSYQDRTIDELSKAVYELSTRLERSEKLQREMASKLRELLADSGQAAPGNARPPHW